MNEQDYQQIADMVREDHAQLADTALHYLRDSTTVDGKVWLGCLARGEIDQVHMESRLTTESSALADSSLSSALRELLIEILGAIEKHPGECPTLSSEWNAEIRRWKHESQSSPRALPDEKDDIGDELLRDLAQGFGPWIVSAYFGTCFVSIGLLCPNPGAGYEVALSTTFLDTAMKVDGIGAAERSTNVAYWSRLSEDRESFALALAEALSLPHDRIDCFL